ncbi:helix-turn-helix domain-containing protein [Vreelandella massiliensis]|uniref:helix-turn-helix domain-containing protein n=1 Tax=Vreelandella massiliensis TaxID=1816686 RepID=UPI00096A86A7|nr:helix-turn-helix domain-containing protein [Halomonas massiliensis]
MRMTRNKQMILDLLASEPEDEYLPAAAVAERLGKRMTDVARTLRLMEDQGLVVSVVREVPVDRPGLGTYTRALKCYQRAVDI